MNMRKFWLWNLLAVGIMGGCAARHLAVEEAVELLDQESLVGAMIESRYHVPPLATRAVGRQPVVASTAFSSSAQRPLLA